MGLPEYQFIHHEFHLDQPVSETCPPLWKVKIYSFTLHRDMPRNGGMALCIFKFDIRWTLVVSFTPPAALLRRKESLLTTEEGEDGPPPWSGRFGGKKSLLLLAEIEI
jgi:hypothetical protein